jgi:hypothetical protein
MDLHHLLFAGLPAHPIPVTRRADFGWAKSTHRGRSLRLTLSICLALLFEIQ